ncbi:endonuclease/exonuclease/phosphatase family protein [Photobacterium chitinilyticum]|uniref:endonuclease/exonuclease/phosphatase family protein n=1 Tax=Photobacterium chitinilyticum TaxID=2485123 RepID=UPI003D13DC80
MSQENCTTVKQPDTIKVATFNLCNYLEPPYAFYDFENIYSAEQWQKKQNWIINYLSEHQPDVIGFQEVFSPESLQQLVKSQGFPYFAVIDEAKLVDDYIYQSPVVAIASRYPIKATSPVQANAELATAMGLYDNFQFSRQPLRATIDVPHFGLCDCYVVHFKSKRPTDPTVNETKTADKDNTDTDESVIKAFTAEISGGWASSIQRGSEAALLLTAIIERRAQSGNPILLMGDFNDNLHDGVLQHLLIQTVRNRSQGGINQLLAPYRLKDSWALYQAATQNQDNDGIPPKQRAYSHYFGSKGSVLDYILLSCEFDTEYQESLAEVSCYHTYDRHLINPIYEQDSQSTDHAVVMISLTLRS